MKQNLHLSSTINLILLLFLFIYGGRANALEYQKKNWGLYGGIGPGLVEHTTHLNTKSYQPEFCFSTYLIYKIESLRLGLGVGSFAQYGPYVKRMTLTPKDQIISGRGSYTSAAIGPRIQYFFENSLISDKTTSLSMGYLISEQSFKVKSKPRAGEEDILGQKITYEGHGYFIGLSFYDTNQSQREFPWFFEFNFKYLKGKKEVVVGGTRFAVKPLFEETKGSSIKETTVMFIIGLKFI